MRAHWLVAVSATFVAVTAKAILGVHSVETSFLARDQIHDGHRLADDPLGARDDNSNDYNEETPVGEVQVPAQWPGKSSIPITVEVLICLIWIGLIGSVPVITVYIDKRPITKTHIALSFTMWTVFLLGLFIFTQIVSFASGHWTGTRTLTLVETIYLMAQIFTTVGYGDIVPAFDRGRVFVGLYVIFSIFVIAIMVSDLSNAAMDKSQSQLESSVFHDDESDRGSNTKWLERKPIDLPDNQLKSAVAVFLGFVILGVFFFHLWPGEGKTWFQGVYMSIVTLSTVGFGAFTPQTEAGKVFGAFWMLFGAAALVNVVENWVEFTMKLKERELIVMEGDIGEHQAIEFVEKLGGKPQMTKFEFMKLGMLLTKAITTEDLKAMEKTWARLKPDASGHVNFANVKEMVG